MTRNAIAAAYYYPDEVGSGCRARKLQTTNLDPPRLPRRVFYCSNKGRSNASPSYRH